MRAPSWAERYGGAVGYGLQPNQIVILRALQLGDLLCAVPSFRAFRRAWPSARIALIGLPWARDFVRRFSLYFDEFIEFPGYPGLPERPAQTGALHEFLGALRRRRADLAVQLHGDGTITNELVARFGARRMAGFHPPAQQPPAGGDFLEYPSDRHEIRRLLALPQRIGLPAEGEQLEFPIDRGEESSWCRMRFETGLANRAYVCLHAGARAEARRWPLDEFARVGRALAARGLRVVVTGDGAEEEALAARLAEQLDGRALNLAGRTPL
ncbi:MAG: LPS biosynthesis glycosyltransferase, partial [Acidobacteria bacterium]